MRHVVLFSAALLLVLLARSGAADEDEDRYTAVFSDGKRAGGDEVTDWGHPEGKPQLDKQPLFDAQNPVRWLSDNTLSLAPPAAYVETTGCDRLPGAVVEMRHDEGDGKEQVGSDFLVVEPRVVLRGAMNKPLQQVRVLLPFVRRIVWQRRGPDRYQPGTLLARDGSRLEFRRCRFTADAVRLLLESGTRELPFSDIAELHLPHVDPWDAYYDELAALCPDLKATLFQWETASGLIVTSSDARFRVTTYSDRNDPAAWYHLVQPAWSLDAFAVRHREVCTRRYFSPHEVPLSRIAPERSTAQPVVHDGWPWQANRNVDGERLRGGGKGFGWGLGVHGGGTLEFPLPPLAVQFRTQLGLDPSAGEGGCVRGLVLLSADGKQEQLYRSPLLIGSQTVDDTKPLRLRNAGANGARRLLLSVDPVLHDHPKGADPLDIRDTLNWLEPVVVLDAKALAADVRRRAEQKGAAAKP